MGTRGDTYKEYMSPFVSPSASPSVTLLSLDPPNVRLLACKPSWDGSALVIRVQESVKERTRGHLTIALPGEEGMGAESRHEMRGHGQGVDKRGHVQRVRVPIYLRPLEIKTVRVERDGMWHVVPMIEEKSS
jgi:alpha-mannosidase